MPTIPGASERDPENTGKKSESVSGPSKTTLAAVDKPNTLNRQVPKGSAPVVVAPLHPSVNPHSRQKITREKILGMTKPEIKAVAHDRGYKIGADAGRKVLAERFLQAQEGDTSLVELK